MGKRKHISRMEHAAQGGATINNSHVTIVNHYVSSSTGDNSHETSRTTSRFPTAAEFESEETLRRWARYVLQGDGTSGKNVESGDSELVEKGGQHVESCDSACAQKGGQNNSVTDSCSSTPPATEVAIDDPLETDEIVVNVITGIPNSEKTAEQASAHTPSEYQQSIDPDILTVVLRLVFQEIGGCNRAVIDGAFQRIAGVICQEEFEAFVKDVCGQVCVKSEHFFEHIKRISKIVEKILGDLSRVESTAESEERSLRRKAAEEETAFLKTRVEELENDLRIARAAETSCKEETQAKLDIIQDLESQCTKLMEDMASENLRRENAEQEMVVMKSGAEQREIRLQEELQGQLNASKSLEAQCATLTEDVATRDIGLKEMRDKVAATAACAGSGDPSQEVLRLSQARCNDLLKEVESLKAYKTQAVQLQKDVDTLKCDQTLSQSQQKDLETRLQLQRSEIEAHKQASEVAEEYKTRCLELERQLGSASDVAKENARKDLEAACKKLEKQPGSVARCNKLEKDLSTAHSKLNTTNQKLQRMQNFEDLHKKAVKDIGDLKTKHKTDLKKLTSTKDNEIENAVRKYNFDQTELIHMRADVHRLKEENESLKAKEPIVKVGAAILNRFLEQARVVVFGTNRGDLDTDIITAGNAAAHQGNYLAIYALIKSELCTVSRANEIFDKLWNWAEGSMDPGTLSSTIDYPCIRKAGDLSASIRTLNDGMYLASLPEPARGLYSSIVNVWNSRLKDDTLTEFDEDPVVISALESLQAETQELIRKRQRR